jgi:hypothetical protein
MMLSMRLHGHALELPTHPPQQFFSQVPFVSARQRHAGKERQLRVIVAPHEIQGVQQQAGFDPV